MAMQWQSVDRTDLGALYHGDCLPWLQALPDSCASVIFADPPFNLDKDYGEGINDHLDENEYLAWSRSWLRECVRCLASGGSLFIFNLPRWLIEYGAFLNQNDMQFRHWIACRMPKTYPRGKRLSPAHYGLLYYTKGDPRVFNRVYTPISICRHCGKELRDYGGHRDKLNAQGLNMMDVFDNPEEIWSAPTSHQHMDDLWNDVPPVRHSKYKTRQANELSPIMLERVIALASHPGDLILDPFGGSGTTYVVAEKLERRWLGIEIGDIAPAIRRLHDLALNQATTCQTGHQR